MSKFTKIILCLFVCFTLSSCSFMSAYEQPKPFTLEIPKPDPLSLYVVEWDVRVIEDKPLYTLNQKNFENLSKNTEMIQNRISLDNTIIQSYEKYYTSPTK